MVTVSFEAQQSEPRSPTVSKAEYKHNLASAGSRSGVELSKDFQDTTISYLSGIIQDTGLNTCTDLDMALESHGGLLLPSEDLLRIYKLDTAEPAGDQVLMVKNDRAKKENDVVFSESFLFLESYHTAFEPKGGERVHQSNKVKIKLQGIHVTAAIAVQLPLSRIWNKQQLPFQRSFFGPIAGQTLVLSPSRLLARSPYLRTAEVGRTRRHLILRRRLRSCVTRRSQMMAAHNILLRTGPLESQKPIRVPQLLAVPPPLGFSKAAVDRWSCEMTMPSRYNAAGGEGSGSNDRRGSDDARIEGDRTCHHGDGDGDNITNEGGEEKEDAGDDQDDNDGTREGAVNAAVRCSCVVCNIQLGAVGFVLIPGRGYAHRACAEEFDPDYNLAPRTRQRPTRLVPAFEGTSHLQRDSEVTRPIMPMTHHQHPLSMIPTNPRTIAVGGRRRGGVGQGRGPVEGPDQRFGLASFPEMLGLWVALADGRRRCLVVATGFASITGQQVLLVAPCDGGSRLAVSWQNGQPAAEVIPNEPRELAEGRLPDILPNVRPRGVWRNGSNVEAVVKVARVKYIIHREVLSDTMTIQRAQREAARALSVMEALSIIARRPVLAAPVRGREETRAPVHPSTRRPGSLGARQPTSQRGAARALFVTAPTSPELVQLRGLAGTVRGLNVDIVVLTACPFNALGAHCWGSSWVAIHGGTQLARGSCSALTLNCSAALLAGAQEALLGLHTFLGAGGIQTNRVLVSLSIRRTQEARSNAGPRTELTAAALTALYAALAGGVEALMGLSIRLMHHNAAGPPGFPQGLLADLRRDAGAAANNLRDDLANHREGQAVWADSLPGSWAFIEAIEANPCANLPPVPPASLHLAPAFGTFAPALRAILGRRTSTGTSEGTLCAFALMSGQGELLATPALAALGRSNAEGDALLLSELGRRLGQTIPGDLVTSVFGVEACGDSERARRFRNTLCDVARDLFIRNEGDFGRSSFAHQFSLSQPRWPGEGGCRPISQLEGTALATLIGSEISLLQSGSAQQPQQAVIFRPQVISPALSPALATLRLPGRGTGPLVLIERQLQGCTVVATELIASPTGAGNGDRVDDAAAGADDLGNFITGGEATSPPASPERPSGGLGPVDWQCPICYENRPQQARVMPQCCGSLICSECTRQIVELELAAVRELIRRGSGRANGAQKRRRRLPFICPMCRRRSALQRGTPGAAAQLVIGSPSPQRPTIVANEPPDRAPVRRALDVPLRDAALVQYSPLYCAVFNYAALPQDSRALALGAARDAAAARFAPRHMDQIRTMLIDARRLFQRWGREARQALVHWNEGVDSDGYAGAAEQIAVRVATEAAGGVEAQDFWLSFDLLGPELIQGYQGQVAARRNRVARVVGADPGTQPQLPRRQQLSPLPPSPSPPPPPSPSPPLPLPPPLPQVSGDEAQLQEILRPDHPMWSYLRRVPIEQLLMRPQLIPKKHFTNKAIAAQLERAIKVASARCGGLDIDVDHDAHKFVACVMWVILGRHRSAVAPAQARAPWAEVVKERVDRLYRGEFEALFDEAAAAAEVAGPRGGQVDQARRAVELAHLGKVSKAFGALTSGGVLPLEEEAVRDAFSAFLQPNNEPPIAGWRDFVMQSGRADPGSAVYKFELGECEIIGPNGQSRVVNTLEHALQQCDTTAAAGISGLGFDLLARMDPATVRPLLRVWFGQGRWDYTRRVEGRVEGVAYHAELHALLVSNRGVALDKDGTGYVQGRAVTNVRPISIGDAIRRLAAKAMLLQLGTGVEAKLRESGQYGAGTKGGADLVYHKLNESMDSFVAAHVASGITPADASNAFCSMNRAAMQRGVLKFEPKLLPSYDFLYGPNATGSCYFYGAGGLRPLGSCRMTDGVAQGDGFGPLFFSLGLDELLTAVREAMRDLTVDSTMLGQVVHVAGSADGRLASGAHVPVTDDLPLTLVAAPTYAEIDALVEDARGALQVSVRVGPVADPASYIAVVSWGSVRLRAEVLLVAYLDDIYCSSEAFLIQPYRRTLRAKGKPLVGLEFTSVAKNYTYVPRCFAAEIRTMLPDASIVDDDTPGATPMDQLRHGASRLPAGSSGLLVTHVGVAKVMGAPFRALCPGEGLERDFAWLLARADEQAVGVAKLFAHIGLKAIDDFAGERHGQAYVDYKARAVSLPESETQVQMLLTRYCLATRLNCLARYLPSAISQPALSIVDDLLVAAVAGCAGETSPTNLTVATQGRALLAMRYGGVLPGAATTAPAQHISSVAAVERSISGTGAALELRGVEPSALRRVRERIQAREANATLGALTPLESSLVSDIELINAAHADSDVRGLRLSSTRGGDESRRQSPAATVEEDRQTAVGGAGVEGVAAQQTALVALSDLGSAAGKSRALSEGLWGRAFLTAYNSASDGERLRMAEGLGKGAGLALLAVPMADAFDFTQSQFQRILSNYLGLDGAISTPHTHHCGGGVTRVLTQGTLNHLQVCPVLGRNSAPHNAVRDVLSHLVVQNGVTNAAVVETRLTAADGGTFDADVVYFDPSSRARVILEVSIVTIGSDTSLGRGARAGLDGVNAQLRAREEEKRNHGVVRRLLNEAGNNTIFTPIVMSACGAMGPSMVAFLKHAYGRAKDADKFLMSQQPALKYTWNTLVASSFWDMRLSIACAATDAEFQNRIILHDNTLNLPVVAQQPHPDPNYAPHAAARLLAVA